MKDFLKNKQKWIVGLVILGLMFVAGGFGVASYLYGNRCYRGYEVRLITKGKVCGMAVMK